MSQLTIKSLCVYLLVAVTAGAGLDAYLNLDDKFLGEICDPNDVDVVEFDALGGSAARFHITGAGNLRPQAMLVDESTGNVLFDIAATGQRLFVSAVDLPSTGRYVLSIASADGSTGDYELKTVGRTNPKKLNFVDTQNVASGGTGEVEFDALAGYRLSATFIPTGPGVRVDNARLDGPDGPVNLSGFITSFPDLIRIKELPLGITSLASFKLSVDNIGATGNVKTHVRLAPTLDRKTVVEDDCN